MVLYRYSDRDLIYSSAELQKWLLLTQSTFFFSVKLGVSFRFESTTLKHSLAWTLQMDHGLCAPKVIFRIDRPPCWHVSVTSNPHEICRHMQSRQARWVSTAWDVMDGFPLSLWEHDRKPAELWPLCRLTGDLTKEDWGVFLDFTGLMEFYEVSCCSGSYYNNI